MKIWNDILHQIEVGKGRRGETEVQLGQIMEKRALQKSKS